jgi:GTP cyclohydrolase II
MTSSVVRIAQHSITTEFGRFRVRVYITGVQQQTIFALFRGPAPRNKPAPLRVQLGCTSGPTFHSHDCDCSEQIAGAMRAISKSGFGCMLYLRDYEGFGFGVALKAKAMEDEERTGKPFVAAEKTAALRTRIGSALVVVPDLLDDLRAELFGSEVASGSYTLLGDSRTKYRQLRHLGVPIRAIQAITVDRGRLTRRAIRERSTKKSRKL